MMELACQHNDVYKVEVLKEGSSRGSHNYD
jgi:hypothetical protein